MRKLARKDTGFIINLIGGDNYLVAMTIYSIAKHSREIERGALKLIGMCTR